MILYLEKMICVIANYRMAQAPLLDVASYSKRNLSSNHPKSSGGLHWCEHRSHRFFNWKDTYVRRRLLARHRDSHVVLKLGLKFTLCCVKAQTTPTSLEHLLFDRAWLLVK